MNTDVAKMKAKLTAFFDTATADDISALLKRTNYDFYKNVRIPREAWFETDFALTETTQVVTLGIPVAPISRLCVPNRPITYIGRGCLIAHEDFELAA